MSDDGYRLLIHVQVKPNIFNVNAVLMALSENGRWLEAIEMLESMEIR